MRLSRQPARPANGGEQAAGGPLEAAPSRMWGGRVGPLAGRYDTLIGFALVGATGIVVNQALLWALVSLGGVNYILAAVVATQGSTTWNYGLNELWVFRGRSPRGHALERFLAFAAMNNAALLIRAPLLALLTSGFGIHYLVSNLITLVVLFATRFAVSDRLVWRTAAPVAATTGPAPGRGRGDPADGQAAPAKRPPPRFEGRIRYDLHGFASVASDVELPELSHFRVQFLPGGADVEVRVGSVGSMPRPRVKVDAGPGAVAYEEHLGPLGGNFRIDIGDRIRVTVAPLLARSPHVVYTNVVEALTRFVLASRDLALLHSATLVIERPRRDACRRTPTRARPTRSCGCCGRSAACSSQTTCPSSRPTGACSPIPKPLTISHHTLGAVGGAVHSPRERAVLVAKSSIHSKRGRGTGMRLADMNLPIMAINAMTQIVVPPPKYSIDRLVPCEIGVSTKVKDLFLIARGPKRDEFVDLGDRARHADREHGRRLRVPALPALRARHRAGRRGLLRAAAQGAFDPATDAGGRERAAAGPRRLHLGGRHPEDRPGAHRAERERTVVPTWATERQALQAA